ncbi:LuxR C-terminal-related transcriptional regulator [Nocardioides deserti]|uniref:Response regulator transcription factor n=1 Tax=Nocardioides deserti TaxID=1588644 RepID=A0ABR6U451_9ACTN|nr:LuxR C-terminal-related transcriptional regulator [Nocardioides deserti]MBC2959207.1 response regulator transcription factor [Nocardioides deserti]GGO68393.1 DNA-binding response regulator [Nocardioides deserti]
MLTESLAVVFERCHYQYRVVPIPREPASVGHILSQVLKLRPDVLVINADLGPTCSGAALIAPMTRAGAAVVVLTDTLDEARAGECVLKGARVVLPKSESLAVVVSTIRRIVAGECVLDRAERRRLVEAYQRRESHEHGLRDRLERLSPQEAEVLRHLIAGRTTREVAQVRVVSEATVRTQVKAVLAKLEVSSQLAAVALARRAGWSAPTMVLGSEVARRARPEATRATA